jgi:hypothetical protein
MLFWLREPGGITQKVAREGAQGAQCTIMVRFCLLLRP